MDNEEKYNTTECLEFMKDIGKEGQENENFFYQILKLTITLPFLANAGAAIALANIFKDTGNPKQIIFAILAFLLGVVIGLVTIAYVFFLSYKQWGNTRLFWLSLSRMPDKDLNKIYQNIKKYSNDRSIRDDKTRYAINFCIANGSVSIFFCFISVYFIGAYVLKSYCLITGIALVLGAYCLICLILMNFKLK